MAIIRWGAPAPEETRRLLDVHSCLSNYGTLIELAEPTEDDMIEMRAVLERGSGRWVRPGLRQALTPGRRDSRACPLAAAA